MSFVKSLIIAIAMYSKIPMPRVDWDKESSKYVFVFFPVVGAILGVLFVLWFRICEILGFQGILRGVGFIIISAAVTGGIHLDGYTDVSDAISSYGDREKRLEILKDPHVGAFGVIRLVCLLLIQLALFTSIESMKTAIVVGLSCVISRALSGMAAISFKNARGEGTLFSFSNPSDRGITRVLLLVILATAYAGGICVLMPLGLCAMITSICVFIYYYFYSKRVFGGITGDLAGWFLVLCETWMLAGTVLVTNLSWRGHI